jgi:hypothetical protein
VPTLIHALFESVHVGSFVIPVPVVEGEDMTGFGNKVSVRVFVIT